jgi:glycosyltransferase involved in cell wall biosynthesis
MSDSVLNDLKIFTTKKPKAFCPHPLYDNFGKKINRKTAIESLKLDINTRYILFFGLIRDYKGLDLLLNAMANPEIKQMNLKLIVAGEFYSASDKYIEMINTLKIKDKIILHSEFVPDKEVANYFCSADIIVQPYKTATQSGVTQIAYHFEKPMIVTNVGGLPEIVPHKKAGYVVEPQSNEIAKAIIDFYKNKNVNYFDEGIKHEKKKYEWSRMTKTIINLYNKIK